MTTMLHETRTEWLRAYRIGDFWERVLILWMLVIAPSLVVGSTLSYAF